MAILRRLARERAHDPVKVVIVGAGFIGSRVVHHLSRVHGLDPALVVNRSPDRAVAAYRAAGADEDLIVVSDDERTLSTAIAAGLPAVATDPSVIAAVTGLEIVLDASSSIDHSARVAEIALGAGLDCVTLSAEMMATLGHELSGLTDRTDRMLVLADGDQPAVLAHLVDFVAGSGFDVVAAINCKGFLDRHATRASTLPWSRSLGLSPGLVTAFTDGTKMNIENACLANGTGLLPETLGMRGVETTLADAAQDIVAALDGHGAVDYTLGGDFGGGVLVVGRSSDPIDAAALRYLKMGDGPYYTFVRPYHLVHFEVPLTIAALVLHRDAVLPAGPRVTEVVTIAKRDLPAGTRLDGIGGDLAYGLVDTTGRAAGLLPIGLSEGAILTRAVRTDEPVDLASVELDTDRLAVRLRTATMATEVGRSGTHGSLPSPP